ncbi:MAG: ATP-binding protein [Acidobacteriota bacterium]
MKRFRINLGTLVLFSTLMLVLLFGGINLFWVRREINAALSRELEARALLYAQGLALQAVDAIVLEDRLLLQRFIDEARSLDAHIAYIFLVGPRGELVAHTFAGGFPVELLSANPLPADRDYMMRRIVDRQGRQPPVRDVVAPIAGGYAGFAHVGLREDLILSGVRGVTQAVNMMVAVLVLLGLGAALLFARIVTRPLERLAASAARVNLEALQDTGPELPPPQPAGLVRLETEVDRLDEEFRRMVERLSTASRQLKKTQEQLMHAERLSAIGQLAAGLAHELNNPLAGLKNCIRRIQREPDNREQLNQYLSMMQASVERMQRVLQGLLNLARPRRLELKKVALAPLVERVAVSTGERLGQLGIAARRVVKPEAAVAWADPFQLEQALLNLAINACDSLEERRQADPAFTPELEIRAESDHDRLWIEVRDNGVGIAAEDLARVFDPFFSTKMPGRGTGLGLSVAQDIVRAHGGEILAESRPGAGARFRIVLPMRREGAKEETSLA